MPHTSVALLSYFKYLLVFRSKISSRSYFSKYNFLVATKQFNIFQIDHAITAKAEFLYKSGRQGYLATEQANKDEISIWPRCAHPSCKSQYNTKTGALRSTRPSQLWCFSNFNEIIINRVFLQKNPGLGKIRECVTAVSLPVQQCDCRWHCEIWMFCFMVRLRQIPSNPPSSIFPFSIPTILTPF